ncbi:MAG: Nif3-like dinuclear metal center hexameric protein [Methanomicrobiaceae archaeon]|nr:Nif3-like dinuclear metal center hexameric protein [Methanomicrobiaceae archaeon]
MERHQFIGKLEAIAPLEAAEEYDEGRIGLVVEGATEIGRVACALDATPSVVLRAVELGADALVVHHTPIWDPVTRVEGGLARILGTALSAGLNVYVMHSNFDRAPGGINDALADLLGLKSCTRLSLGVLGTCSLSLEEVSSRLGGALRVWGGHVAWGSFRLAVAGGNAFDLPLIGEAAVAGASAFLSAELKHSVARLSPIPLLESTHYALEAPGMRALAAREGWEFIDDPPSLTVLP